MDINHLSQKQACELLGVEDRTLRNWAKETPPVPSHGSGKALYYVWSEVFEWWRKREFKNLMGAASKQDPKLPNKLLYEAIEQKADAEMKLLKLAEARGQSANLGDVERKMSSLMSKIRTQCLSIRSRVLSEVGKEAADVVHREVIRALSLLATGEGKP